MFFSKIKQFFVNNKKIIYYIWFFLVVYYLNVDWVFAVEPPETDKTKEMIDTTLTIVNGLLWWIAMLLWVLSYLVTLFLSPWWINWSFFNLTTHFNDLWILVSNIVYFIFAFILIWIAFMNIVWKEWEQYELKKALPKFVIWILIVPFSWFFIQFILSISAVLTISALTLPSDTFPTYEEKLNDILIPQHCEITIQSSNSAEKSDNFKCEDPPTMNLNKAISDSDSSIAIFGIISTYTYGIMNLEKLNDMKNEDISAWINTIWDLVTKLLFDFLFVIVYWILMITLCLVLVVRWIYLWLYIIFSPAFWLIYFFWKEKLGEWMISKFNLKDFIDLAMVPVYTMLALSFGLLFISVIWNWMFQAAQWGESDWMQWVILNDDYISIWKFKLTILWVVWTSANSEMPTLSLFKNAAGDWLWVIGTLILNLFWIVVLWWAVMAALRSSSITSQITQPIHDFGKSVWWLAQKAPMYAPVFGWQSMQSMNTISWKLQSSISQKSLDRANDFSTKHMPFLNPSSTGKIADVQGISNRLKNNYMDNKPNKDLLGEWKKLLKTMWDTQSVSNLSQSHDTFKLMAKRVWISDNEIKEFKFNDKKGVADVIKRIEAAFDTVWWWAIKWQRITKWTTLWPDKIDEAIKDMSPDSVNSTTNNSLNITKKDKNEFDIWGMNITLEDWKITQDRLSNFAKATKGMNLKDVKKLLDNANYDKDLIWGQLEKWRYVKDWIIVIP